MAVISTNTNISKKQSRFNELKSFFIRNSVTILFVIVCLLAVIFSKQSLYFIVRSLVTRITRNSFLVLALILPVLAGMGLNFSITVGAMAAQMTIIAITHWGIQGIGGFVLCAVLTLPLSIIFGILVGKLLNKTRGQEMIASMITGYFSNGIYQFIFLFLIGTLIPMKNNVMVLSSGIGIRNAVDLARDNGIKQALDNLLEVPFFPVLLIMSILALAFYSYRVSNMNKHKLFNKSKNMRGLIGSAIVALFSFLLIFTNIMPQDIQVLEKIQVPVMTILLIAASCIFHIVILKTKLGQDFRAVGQDQHIAEVAGINVNKVRVIAVTISTVLAAWGQLIFLQNMGVLNTYGSHIQIATFSIAALLVGGASVSKATVGQALLGVVLFHTLFLLSPMAGKNLFGDAQIGEFFRAFIAYGVIGVSLGLHAWKKKAVMLK